MRRPAETTVSAAKTKPSCFSATALALAVARRSAWGRGSSPFFTLSSIPAGMLPAGMMPACASSALRRGLSLARISLAEAIGDPPLGEVIGRHLDHDLVAGEHADAVLAHLARGVGDDLMAVLQEH